MTETKTLEKRNTYSEQQIQQGLTALALWNGRPRKASEALAGQGIDIPPSTLVRWRDKLYPERYATVSKGVQDRIWARTSDRWRGVVEEAADGATEAVVLTRLALADPDGTHKAKDLSATAKNLAFAGGIANDKAATIDGRPTEIHESRGMNEILKSLSARFPSLVAIDSSATEVTPEPLPASPSSLPSQGTQRNGTTTRELGAGESDSAT